MKIGILIKEFDALENWELRIIECIRCDPNLELTLLIKAGHSKENDKVTLGSFIFKKQISFEKKRYLKNNKTVDKLDIIKYLQNIPNLIFEPKIKNNIYVFDEEEIRQVEDFHLNVILKFQFKNIGGGLQSAAKHGIWYLNHSNNKNRSGPAGFWEVLKKEPVVEVALLQLIENSKKFQLIDKAFFNRHKYSYVETNFKILESSVTLLMKNLRKLDREDLLIVKKDHNLNCNFDLPKLSEILDYQMRFYSNLGKGFLGRLGPYYGKRPSNWTLCIGKGDFLDTDLSKLISVRKPKEEFWADPFLFMHKEETYVFFEKFPFDTKRGIISCGRIEGSNLIDIKDVLQLSYHLSYPFIFEEEGEIFMMPETSANSRLEIYKCIQFPDKWELYRTAFEGEKVADSFFYTDEKKQKWLFTNKASGGNSPLDNELYIYKVDSYKLNKLEAHLQNPIYVDSRIARNGGAIFTYRNQRFRPSQSNTDGVYGRSLNINQIKKLSLKVYEEEKIEVWKPEVQKKFKAIHHMHQIEGQFVFDVKFN